MLHIQDLHAGYGKMGVVFGADITAARGKITLIIGPNGAGKSTVVKSVFGLTDISHGAIVWENTNITNAPTHTLIRRGLVYIPQGRSLFPNLSVRENLALGAVAKPYTEVRARLKDMFREFPILALKQKQPARLLSGGQQQILALARALMVRPLFLLLDEPSLGLSPVMMQTVFKTLARLRDEQGIGMLFVEQNARAASQIADSIVLLEQGRVVLSG
jgi:branched-chain amino acid transport system ATP-binding protein